MYKRQGYDKSENTWESHDNLSEMQALEDWEMKKIMSNIVQGSIDMDNTPSKDNDPIKVSDALARSDANEWKLVMQDKYRSLQENKTWDVVPRPKDHNVIDTKWLFKIKRNPDSSINKCKARYFVRGFTQVPGVDFDETYSPTVLYQVLKVIIAIACLLGLQLHQMDMKTAFLNSINAVSYTHLDVYKRQVTKLTGTASLLWQHHKKNFDVSSPLCVRCV